MPKDATETAVLYRIVMPDHMCPWGIKAKALLKQEGFEVDDRHLTTRAEVDAFKAEHQVETTPQVFISDERVGGYDALAERFGKATRQPGETSYQPVIALFSVAALLAVAVTWLVRDVPLAWATLGWFIAISMVLLGLQKLMDIEGFATMFLNYDLLAQRWPRYGYIYPLAETGAGLLMLGGVLAWVAAPAALVISTIGAVSVFKAVYIDRRELKCACVGGDSNVPLGFVSLTENLMMMAMALWMIGAALG